MIQGNLKRPTLRQYLSDVRAHLLPTFGELELPRVNNVGEIESFQNKLTASGQSNWSVRRIVNTLSGILDHAYRRRLLTHNAAQAARKPEAKSKRKPVLLSVEEVYDLAKAAPTADEQRLILTLAFTGVRKSELFALRWENVRLDDGGGSIVIVENCYEGEVGERTKTKTGMREIPFGSIQAGILREQASEGRYSPHSVVYPSPEGARWHSSNFHKRVWSKAREKSGLHEVQMHDLLGSS